MRTISFFFAVFILPLIALGQQESSKATSPTEHVEYICPMYCTDDISLVPANCRVCGMPMEDRTIVENPKDYKIIRPQDALDKMKSDSTIVLLDVRSREEYNDKLGHLDHSIQIPIDELGGKVGELEKYKDKTIIAYCSHGIRSARAARLLTKRGYTVLSLMGGLTKWNREKYPVVRN